jgi:hypothetical protein
MLGKKWQQGQETICTASQCQVVFAGMSLVVHRGAASGSIESRCGRRRAAAGGAAAAAVGKKRDRFMTQATSIKTRIS